MYRSNSVIAWLLLVLLCWGGASGCIRSKKKELTHIRWSFPQKSDYKFGFLRTTPAGQEGKVLPSVVKMFLSALPVCKKQVGNLPKQIRGKIVYGSGQKVEAIEFMGEHKVFGCLKRKALHHQGQKQLTTSLVVHFKLKDLVN